jgi:integral membrane protein
MMSQANLSFDTKWIAWTIGLYILSGICWLPVVWLQIRLAKMAQAAHEAGENSLPQKYWRYARIWELLGYPAFCATVVIYFLMVLKPA